MESGSGCRPTTQSWRTLVELDQMQWSEETFPWSDRLLRILRSWEGTPYKERQCAKGGAVDCVRFTCAVYDELEGVASRDHLLLPQDQALHSRETAIAAMKLVRSNYLPNKVVESSILEPGDQLTMGFIDGGPGHSMLAGPDGFLWHTDGVCVTRTGLVVPSGMELVRIYRAINRRDRWHR